MSVFGIARDYAAAQARRYLKASAPSVAAAHGARLPGADRPQSGLPGVRLARDPRREPASDDRPDWLRERLRRVGINSISPIVDVTNYVMTELGQPLHAYDLSRLAGGIHVRAARPGERITLLDDKEYELDPGVHGHRGRERRRSASRASWAAGTRRSCRHHRRCCSRRAHFTPDAIAGRARRLGLFTDAAQRFERGVDPSLPPIALERATALAARDRRAASRARCKLDSGERGPRRRRVGGLRRSRVARLLGASVPDGEVEAILAAISEGVRERVPRAGACAGRRIASTSASRRI